MAKDTHYVYEQAHRIDDIVNEFIGQVPLNSETAHLHRLFIRTIGTYVHLMQTALDGIKKEKEGA